ncbi:MAG: hypothetical protein IPJ75_00015 [Ignavibacteriales bacterium]|nr:hypothetical protein [Ignavibacteriales bacterium]
MKKNTILLAALIITGIMGATYAQTWNTYTTGNGLPDNQIRCITTASNGTVWIGTKTKGVFGYNGSSFISFPRTLPCHKPVAVIMRLQQLVLMTANYTLL